MTAENDVRPFAGLHYNPVEIPSIGDCLSQPYDVISPALQEAYYARHPYNVVRLILGKTSHEDDERDNRYTRSRQKLTEWRKAGVLVTSPRPAFWVYEQRYNLPWTANELSIHGFIGTVRLQDYESGAILRHEKVMAGPIEDRLRLTSACEAQFESIWGIYDSRESAVDDILKEAMSGEPFIDYAEPPLSDPLSGVRHRLWRLDAPASCEEIHRATARQPIYIADGHHRYQTMLTYRDSRRRENPAAGHDAPWEFIMMHLVNAAAAELTILPYHRILHGLKRFREDAFLRRLRRRFDVRPSSPGEAVHLGARDSREPAFGLAVGRSLYTVTLRDPELYLHGKRNRLSPAHALLDVTVLNDLVLNRVLGFSEDQIARQSNIEYTQNGDEAVSRARRGEAELAFLLRPPTVETIMELSRLGEMLPRKSTFFHPKPLSGLIFHLMEKNSGADSP